MRAALSRLLLERVEGFEPTLRRAVTDAVSSATLDTIRRTLPIGWLEMTPHMEFCGCLCDVVGELAYRDLWVDVTKAFCDRPLLRGIVAMGTRLYAGEPQAALRQLPRMYAVGTQGVGELVVTSDDGRYSIRLDGFPAGRHDFVNYVVGLRGAVIGVSELLFTGMDVEVEPESVDVAGGSAVFSHVVSQVG